MADHTMATVLFISVFIFLFFKFCLGVGPLGAAALPLSESDTQDAANLAAGRATGPLDLTAGLPPITYKCPVGTAYSVATGACKDLVRSNKSLAERLQLFMPYLSAVAGGRA